MYHDSYQDNSESETKYLRYMLNSREKELQAFKEKSNTTNDYDKLK